MTEKNYLNQNIKLICNSGVQRWLQMYFGLTTFFHVSEALTRNRFVSLLPFLVWGFVVRHDYRADPSSVRTCKRLNVNRFTSSSSLCFCNENV